jgi:hypothetical protein
MCIQCAAGAAPYVGLAVGGLRAMSWRARRASRGADEPVPAPEGDGPAVAQPAPEEPRLISS